MHPHWTAPRNQHGCRGIPGSTKKHRSQDHADQARQYNDSELNSAPALYV